MFSRFVIVFTSTLFLANECLPWEQPTIGEIIETSKAGLVKIIVTTADGKFDYGSGFVLTSDGYVVTAAHLLIHDSTLLSIDGRLAYLNNDDSKPAGRDRLTSLREVYKDAGSDVALLKFDELPRGMRPLRIADALPGASDTVWVLGFPGGGNISTSYPAVFQGTASENRFQFQGISNFGNSGGPIINSAGNVVGIVNSSETSVNGASLTNQYYGVPYQSLPAPSDFKKSGISPVFAELKTLKDDQVTEVWTDNAMTNELDAFREAPQKKSCGVAIPEGWQLIEDKSIGFNFLPPDESQLAKGDFRFEFGVSEMPKWAAAFRDGEDSGSYGPSPFHFIPASGQSILLTNLVDGKLPGQQESRTPFIFDVQKGRPSIFQFFPRFFGDLDFRPANADSAVLICTENGSIPPALFFNLCEALIKKVMTSYYVSDNPCLPGHSTKNKAE